MRSSVVTSALVAVIVGFGGSVAIVLAGTQAVGATPAETASCVTALCVSMAATSALMSFVWRMPLVTAWSTPGAALIAATAAGGEPVYDIHGAVGAFLFAAGLILLSAAVKPLATLIAKIPGAVAAAMLAGVLIGFSIAVFDAAAGDPLLVLPLLGVFLLVRLASATWAVIAVLAAGVAWAAVLGRIAQLADGAGFAVLHWVTPDFAPSALIGLGLPLFLVSMASQNLPGFAVLRAAGFEPPTRPALAVTGLASLLTAPFGAHTTTMAAITASLCTGPDTQPDPARRWPAGLVYGAGYLVLAVVGVSVVAGFAALPPAVIVTVAGLALVGPLTNALTVALEPAETRFPAILTLTATASGFTLLGIGAAFWGLMLGLAALGLDRLAKRLREA
jgi:benzoate membrane transport protein